MMDKFGKNGVAHEDVHGITQEEIDQWYEKSICRYNELMMLELEQIPCQMTVGGPETLFILEEKRSSNGRSQILSAYQLPDKIVKSRQIEIAKSSDLKIKAGVFLDTKLQQVIGLYGKNRLIASESANSGVTIFAVSEHSDVIEKENLRATSAGLIAPHFALIDDETLILSKTVSTPSYSLNLTSDALHQLKLDELSLLPTDSDVIPFAISRHSVALGVQKTGFVVIYDLRSHNTSASIDAITEGSTKSKVFFNASYKPFTPYTDSTFVISASTDGKTVVYDLRSLSKPYSVGTIFPCAAVRMSPNEKYFSASTKSGDVGVFEFSSQIDQVFTHEGHNKVELSCRCTNQPADHLWFDDRTIISAALNRTVNIWQFNV